MINWKKIKTEFETTTITLKALAEKYDVSSSTMRSRKNRENWQRNDATQRREVSGNVATDKKGGQKRNKNAQGNKGGAPPKGNKNAVKHGLFAKWLPEETAEIMESVAQSEPADIIWNNIMIQYTTIIRSQQIMFVSNQDDLSKEASGWTSGEGGSSETYAVQYAWDKQANFLSAQSRAMSTLSNMIKQFVSIADEKDERRLKLETMQAQINKLSGPKEGEASKDWKQAVINAANKRVVDNDG